MRLTATDEAVSRARTVSTSISVAAGAVAGSAGVSAALASNVISNTVRAYSLASTISSAGSVELTATSAPSITALSVAATFSAAASPIGAAFSGAGADSRNTISNTIAAFIQGANASSRSSTTAAGNITLSASESGTINAEVGSGAVSAGLIGGSIGISLATNTISSSIKAWLADANVTSSANGISVVARASDSVTTLSVATSIAAAIGGAGAGATATSSVNPNVEAHAGSGTALNAAGDITIGATSTNSATATTYGLAVGAVGIGTTISNATASGSVLAHMDGHVTGVNSLTIRATATDSSSANATAATGGIFSGAGSVANAETSPVVRAYTGIGTISARGAVVVAATLTPRAHATSLGVSVGALAVGVSQATSTVSPTVDAHVGGNITAASLSVTATQALPTGAESSKARATAAAGALIGVTATAANAINGTAGSKAGVTSYVANDSVLTITGATTVAANSNSMQFSEGTAASLAILAAGVASSAASSNTVTSAYLGSGVQLTGSTLSVGALGTDVNFATTGAGSGGVAAGASAKAATSGVSTTLAEIGAGSNINLAGTGTTGTLLRHPSFPFRKRPGRWKSRRRSSASGRKCRCAIQIT